MRYAAPANSGEGDMVARLKHYGWGREGEGLDAGEREFLLARIRERFGIDRFEERAPPRLEDIALPAPRLAPPAALAALCSGAPYDRAAHTYGKAYLDTVRGLDGDYADAPDVVAYPRNEAEVAALIDWAGGAQAAVIPFGGGSSVVGGVEPRFDRARWRGAVTIDLREMGRVVEVDRASRAARIEGGAFGPALEAQLKPHGLTLRHFPQSFEYSTLGGWIATRSGGHFASLYTHIDDFVESVRMVTPKGTLETRRLPGSGAGPAPERLIIGSEGILGIITEAWMRLQDRPRFRAGVRGAVRGLLHRRARAARHRARPDSIPPTAASSIPRRPTTPAPATDGRRSWCWRSNRATTRSMPWMARALECCADHGGTPEAEGAADAHREGAAGRWRNAFIRMPYAREITVARAVINDTFETAITWDRFEAFHDTVKAAALDGDPARDRPRGPGDVPLHPCLSRRAGALFHLPRAGHARAPCRAMAGDQERGLRRAHRGGRHDHASPRGRAPAPALVRPASGRRSSPRR